LPSRGGERERLEEGEGYDRRGRLAVREGKEGRGRRESGPRWLHGPEEERRPAGKN
jgi:hypothetical protein